MKWKKMTIIKKIQEIYPKAIETRDKIIINERIEICGENDKYGIYTQSGLKQCLYLLGYGNEKYMLNLLKAIKGENNDNTRN